MLRAGSYTVLVVLCHPEEMCPKSQVTWLLIWHQSQGTRMLIGLKVGAEPLLDMIHLVLDPEKARYPANCLSYCWSCCYWLWYLQKAGAFGRRFAKDPFSSRALHLQDVIPRDLGRYRLLFQLSWSILEDG